MTRRGTTIGELMVFLSLMSGLIVLTLHTGTRTATHHQGLTAFADDLTQAGAVADRIAREVRASDALGSFSPDGVVRTSGAALVLVQRRRGMVALALERRAPHLLPRLILRTYDALGRLTTREDLGAMGDLRLRFDARRPSEVRMVSFDVQLPRRGPGGEPPSLSSAELLGGTP